MENAAVMPSLEVAARNPTTISAWADVYGMTFDALLYPTRTATSYCLRLCNRRDGEA